MAPQEIRDPGALSALNPPLVMRASPAAEEMALTQSAVCRQIANLKSFLMCSFVFGAPARVKLEREAGETYSRGSASRLDGRRRHLSV